jgi:antitoxin MazE
MKTRIKIWGHNLALRIPKLLAEEVGLEENSKVELSVHEGKLVIEAQTAPRYQLDELLAAVNEENLPAEVETGPALGREAG